MADKHKDDAPPAAASAADHGGIERAKKVAADEIVKAGSEELATIVYKQLPPGVRSQLEKHPGAVRLALLARLIPGIPDVLSEGVQEFVGVVHRLAKEGHQVATNPAVPVPAQATQVAQAASAVSVLVAVDALPDPVKDDFMEWYQRGTHAADFNQFVAGQDVDAIQKMARMSKPQLEQMIAAQKPKAPASFNTLRIAIAADAALTTRVTDFLRQLNTAAGEDRTTEFWKAVEHRQFGSLAEFAAVMQLTDDEIRTHLKMPVKTTTQLAREAHSSIKQALGVPTTPTAPATGAAKWAADRLAKAKSRL